MSEGQAPDQPIKKMTTTKISNDQHNKKPIKMQFISIWNAESLDGWHVSLCDECGEVECLKHEEGPNVSSSLADFARDEAIQRGIKLEFEPTYGPSETWEEEVK